MVEFVDWVCVWLGLCMVGFVDWVSVWLSLLTGFVYG